MDIRILTGKRIEPDRTTTLKLLRMKEDSVGYARVLRFFEENRVRVRSLLLPKAAARIDRSSEPPVLYVLMTLGKAASELVEAQMEAHEYAESLYLNAMIDSCMFAFEAQLLPQLAELCRAEGYGICRQLQIPAELPEDGIRKAADAMEAERILGLRVLENGGMMLPVKSMCLAFRLTDDPEQMHMEHDCSTCDAGDCPLRERVNT